MGQYYNIVNVDKKQYISPLDFGTNVSLCSIALNGGFGAMTALAALLADGNNRGNGDIRSDNPIIGSWAGDRIVIAGDYADAGKFDVYYSGYNLYSCADESYENISVQVMAALMEDEYLAPLIYDAYQDEVKGDILGMRSIVDKAMELNPSLKEKFFG
jgi:hypothetical protein